MRAETQGVVFFLFHIDPIGDEVFVEDVTAQQVGSPYAGPADLTNWLEPEKLSSIKEQLSEDAFVSAILRAATLFRQTKVNP